MSDICHECGCDTVDYDRLLRAEDAPGQYYHIGGSGEGEAGPFASLEEAQVDAEKYLHNSRWGVNEVLILKVVAVSKTETVHKTTWDRT